jgi:hypothetical protein
MAAAFRDPSIPGSPINGECCSQQSAQYLHSLAETHHCQLSLIVPHCKATTGGWNAEHECGCSEFHCSQTLMNVYYLLLILACHHLACRPEWSGSVPHELHASWVNRGRGWAAPNHSQQVSVVRLACCMGQAEAQLIQSLSQKSTRNA